MPVYGKKILGAAAYDHAVATEKHSAGVYGKKMRNGPALQPMPPALELPPLTVDPETDPITGDVVAVVRDAEQFGLAMLRMESLIGQSYSVADVEAALSAAPTIWDDVALAELHRAETAGVRKGVIALLDAVEAPQSDRSLLDDLRALTA